VPRPCSARGRGHLLEAEAAKNWPQGLTSLGLRLVFCTQNMLDQVLSHKSKNWTGHWCSDSG